MTDLTPDHPAVKTAHDSSAAWMADMRGELPDDMMVCVLTAALPHLTSDTEDNLARLRNTPVGRALMAEAWEESRLDHIKRLYVGGISERELNIVRKHITESNPYRKTES